MARQNSSVVASKFILVDAFLGGQKMISQLSDGIFSGSRCAGHHFGPHVTHIKTCDTIWYFFEKRTMPHFASNCVQWTIHFKTVDKFAQFPDKCSECSRKKPFHHPISFPWKTLFHNILKFKLTVITTVVVFILTKHHSQ